MYRLLFFLFISANLIFAQTPKKLKEFSVKNVVNVSVDRLGNLFLIFKNGSIKKYNANGKNIATLKKGELPTLLEPWYHPRIFSYQRKKQEYTFYNHNFSLIETEKVEPSVAIDPYLVCPTNDNKLLVLDQADWSIKKIDLKENVLSEFAIDTTSLAKPEFVYLREYQNLIFLFDKNSGILIYNNLGKKINHIKCVINNFGFYGEELFYLVDDRVTFFDLYTENTREIKLETGRFVILTDERIFLVKENSVAIYEFIAQVQEEKPKED